MGDTKKERMEKAKALLEELGDNFDEGASDKWDLEKLDAYLSDLYHFLEEVSTGVK